jgi:CDP-glycerol glycerophosphotransferase (TagB/SpsB family)
MALFKKRKIWIVGENSGDTLNDNGYCFFRYCCEKYLNHEVFFITKRKYINKDPFLKTNDKILIYGSIRHIVFLFFSNVFIFSQTHRDILYDPLFCFISKGKKIVNLKHGIFGLKKAIAYVHKHCNEPDLITVASEYEKTIFTDLISTEEKKVRITGLARFDYLLNTASLKKQKQILFMPTWRDWIQARNYYESDFHLFIFDTLKYPPLIDFLEEKDIKLKLYLHKIMQKYFFTFTAQSRQIEIVKFGNESVQNLLKESHLLITDYSSVSWDFYFLGKPVVFYQFDVDDYLLHRGSYIDLRNDIFGDRAYKKNELFELIKFYQKNNFTERSVFSRRKGHFFKYVDKYNCDRIYKEIACLDNS